MWRDLAETSKRTFGALANRALVHMPAPWQVVLQNARTLAFGQGQLETARSHLATNALGEAIPWYTYPAIEYLSTFDLRQRKVFEYGSGQSSLYWARQAGEVVSVEHDATWFEQVKAKMPANHRLFLKTEPGAYVSLIETFGHRFDVIVIDGRYRTKCAEVAPKVLADGGLLVLDNADWYPLTAAALRAQGLFQIDFNGFGPINGYSWTTSVFLRAPTSLQAGFRAASPIGGVPNDGDSTD
jgi:hypothetical protein